MIIKYKSLPILLSVLLVVFFGLFNHKVANSKIITNVVPDISSEEWKAVVIEDFEKQADWTIISEPKKNPDLKKNPVPILTLKYLKGSPSDLQVESWTADKKGMEKNQCLGVHFRFKYPGYNSVHILPPPEVDWSNPSEKVLTYDPRTGKKVQEKALQVPGRAKGFSIWFHGRGNDYKLECWIKDYKGDVHILKFGTLNFVGWRALKVKIPDYIPQKTKTYPMTRGLKIVRFVIRATPDATPVDVYMFFDQLKVLTDTFEVNFDGQELHKAFKGGSGPPPPPAGK